jgi:hypothetical protein
MRKDIIATHPKAGAKQGRGRPSRYSPACADQARTLAQLGATEVEIADFLKIPYRTMRNWKLTHPEFGEAIRVGKEPADERVVRSLYQRAIGFHYTEQRAFRIRTGPNEERIEVIEIERYVPPETGACVQWLKSHRPAEWRDKTEHEPDSQSGGTIVAQITIDRALALLQKLDDVC